MGKVLREPVCAAPAIAKGSEVLIGERDHLLDSN